VAGWNSTPETARLFNGLPAGGELRLTVGDSARPMKRFLYLAAAAGLYGLLAGCASSSKPALHVADYEGVIRMACVGDSITYGAGVENRESNNYPAVLGRLLGPRYNVRNFGVSGATLLKDGDKPYWNEPAFSAVTSFDPQVIVLMLGTNDTKPQNWKQGAGFAADLRALLDHFAGLPAHPKIWVCLPVPVYQTEWGINEATLQGEIIPIIERVAKEKRVPTIDLHTALGNSPQYFPDHIHPNAAGAGTMTMTIYAALKGR
jgi:acyl-CoA thioesterase I